MPDPRTDYSPIVERTPLKLPGNASVAVWIIVNVEEWPFDAPMPRTVLSPPQGRSAVPDVPNYAWHEYGMRVGFWRIKEALDKHGIKPCITLNASVCNSYPQIVDAMVNSRWEILGHSYTQRPLHVEENERKIIRKSLQLIKEKTGIAPRGWLGPGLAETSNTPDILAEEGIEYVCDWVNDDQPYKMKVKKGSLYSVPYSQELNDVPIHMVQNHRSSELYDRTRDQLETLLSEGATNARVMAIAVHPYITGVPHRIGYFNKLLTHLKQVEGVWITTGSEILDWYKEVSSS
jgi:peptidoglycan/xylan/chitin deacetylase (PgdA/CDA1 family)